MPIVIDDAQIERLAQIADVARRLGVGASTLYRYLPVVRQSAQGL